VIHRSHFREPLIYIFRHVPSNMFRQLKTLTTTEAVIEHVKTNIIIHKFRPTPTRTPIPNPSTYFRLTELMCSPLHGGGIFLMRLC